MPSFKPMVVNLARVVVLPWMSYKVDKTKGNINHYNNMHITQKSKSFHGLVFLVKMGIRVILERPNCQSSAIVLKSF